MSAASNTIIKLKSSSTRNSKTKEAVKRSLTTVSWTSFETWTEVFCYRTVRRQRALPAGLPSQL